MFDEYDDILDTYALQYILGLSKNTVLKLLQNGTIPSKKVGKKYRILKEDLIHYLHGSDKP
jgi:excisionase family DNA binding protein